MQAETCNRCGAYLGHNKYKYKNYYLCPHCYKKLFGGKIKSSPPKNLGHFAISIPWMGGIILIALIAYGLINSNKDNTPRQQRIYKRPQRTYIARNEMLNMPQYYQESEPEVMPETTPDYTRFSDVIEERKKEKYQQIIEQISKKEHKMGEHIFCGYFIYNVVSARWWKGDSENVPDAKYLLIKIYVKNIDTKNRTIPPFQLKDDYGRIYNDTTLFLPSIKHIDFLYSLNPGVSTVGTVCFDCPPDQKYILILSGGFWNTEKAFVKLDIQEDIEKTINDKGNIRSLTPTTRKTGPELLSRRGSRVGSYRRKLLRARRRATRR